LLSMLHAVFAEDLVDRSRLSPVAAGRSPHGRTTARSTCRPVPSAAGPAAGVPRTWDTDSYMGYGSARNGSITWANADRSDACPRSPSASERLSMASPASGTTTIHLPCPRHDQRKPWSAPERAGGSPLIGTTLVRSGHGPTACMTPATA
jgi:hypothetical protein